MTENRFHFRRSWGAEPVDGGARFRLWAPSQERVALRPQGSSADIAMHPAGEGWFELETDAVGVDEGYSFVMEDGFAVPDPAARAQIGDVHGPSRLVDPKAYQWKSAGWKGRPWEETVFYELHTGTFSEEGTFDGILRKLDHLERTGVTTIEIMPVAQFGGDRGWGYDGVLLYAPHRAYGGPEGLKRLVDAAHERGLMMFLDVVYNHFGPDGSYLHMFAPDFFHPENQTPWGAAIAYEKRPVRDFFIDNALYWLEEYRFDGLRFDAIDQIAKQSREPVLEEIATAIRARITDRQVHLTTEDERNITSLHERDETGRVKLYTGEWNDDVHHVFHSAATGEREGYYVDYAEDPVGLLARSLATGYAFQGEPSPYHEGQLRGVDSAHMPPAAFVDFLQNHDQIGNRAFGERITALAEPRQVECLLAILLLSPHIPLLYMGEEWGETRPFWFFTDFHGDLGNAVREGRRREFAKWPAFASEASREKIADPNAETTFLHSRLDWEKLDEPDHRRRFELVSALLAARKNEIVPLIGRIGGHAGRAERLGERAFAVTWQVDGGGTLHLMANLGSQTASLSAPPDGRTVFAHGAEAGLPSGVLPPWSVVSMTGAANASGEKAR